MLVMTNKNKISKWNVMTLKVDGGCGQRLKEADTCLIHGSYVAVICVFGHLSGQLASKVVAVIPPHKTAVYDHIFDEVEVRPKMQEPVILRDLALNQVGIEDAQASIWIYSQDTINRKIPQLPSMTGFCSGIRNTCEANPTGFQLITFYIRDSAFKRKSISIL